MTFALKLFLFFLSSGTKYTTFGCRVGLTNKTHTVCKCWYYGIVAVLGRDKPYYVRLAISINHIQFAIDSVSKWISILKWSIWSKTLIVGEEFSDFLFASSRFSVLNGVSLRNEIANGWTIGEYFKWFYRFWTPKHPFFIDIQEKVKKTKHHWQLKQY